MFTSNQLSRLRFCLASGKPGFRKASGLVTRPLGWFWNVAMLAILFAGAGAKSEEARCIHQRSLEADGARFSFVPATASKMTYNEPGRNQAPPHSLSRPVKMQSGSGVLHKRLKRVARESGFSGSISYFLAVQHPFWRPVVKLRDQQPMRFTWPWGAWGCGPSFLFSTS
jgi:hypothetical protein